MSKNSPGLARCIESSEGQANANAMDDGYPQFANPTFRLADAPATHQTTKPQKIPGPNAEPTCH